MNFQHRFRINGILKSLYFAIGKIPNLAKFSARNSSQLNFSEHILMSLTLPSLAPAVPSVNDWLLAVNGHSQVISCPHIVSVAFIFWFVPPSTTCTKFSFTALSEMKLTGKTRYYTN